MLDNKTYQGQTGFTWLVTCFFPQIKQWVLLDLGFIAQPTRNKIPQLPNITTKQLITGQIYRISRNPFNYQSAATMLDSKHLLIQAINTDELQTIINKPLANFVIQLHKLANTNLTPNYQINQMHFGTL